MPEQLTPAREGVAGHVDGPLTAAQIRQFRAGGNVVVRGLFDAEEMRDIRAWTEEVQHWPEVPGRHMMYFDHTEGEPSERLLNRIENIMPYHEGFARVMRSDKLEGATGQLFGEPAVLFKDKINFKLAGGGGFEAHQDVQAGWSRYAGIHITALVTIDPATLENGCLELAAGIHDRELIGAEWKPLTAAQLDGVEFVPMEAAPGDAVFFDSFAPHRSGPNHSAAARRVLYLTYNKLSEGDHLAQYYADKRLSYPPDIEREPGKDYVYRV